MRFNLTYNANRNNRFFLFAECTVKKTSQEEELACYETVFQDPAKFGFV